MDLRWIVISALIVLGQVDRSSCNLLSGVLYVCDKDDGNDKVVNIELVDDPNEREVLYVHSSSAFRYLRIRAKITGCKNTALYSEKYLIPGDLGLFLEESQYLLEFTSDLVMGQHVYHVARVEAQPRGLLNKTLQAFNDSISVATGLGCGHIQGYLFEALGATLCTPYRPHHAAQAASGDHNLRVYADDTESDDREELPSLPPQETPATKWKAFIPWVIIHYFSLRSWKSRAESMALVVTLGMYLVYLIFKSRRVIRLYTSRAMQEQERADGRTGVYPLPNMNQNHYTVRQMHQAQNAARIIGVARSTEI